MSFSHPNVYGATALALLVNDGFVLTTLCSTMQEVVPAFLIGGKVWGYKWLTVLGVSARMGNILIFI